MDTSLVCLNTKLYVPQNSLRALNQMSGESLKQSPAVVLTDNETQFDDKYKALWIMNMYIQFAYSMSYSIQMLR